MSLALSAPVDINGADSGSQDTKFPHTRAQLSLIARQSKSSIDNYDSDAEGDELNRVSSSLVLKVAALLNNEQEDQLKKLLKDNFGTDDDTVEQNVLDLMHKHRDDVAGVPFLFLTPTRRPISRPSSRASTHSTRFYPARPDTPTSAPSSPLAMMFRRPHTPVTSPLAVGSNGQPSSYMSARSMTDYSPHSSPVLAHAQATQAQAQYTASLPASPLSSPRLLNAKASEFKPIPRPLSAASSIPGFSYSSQRADTPSPDLWAHNSPRATSNLAIAAPLIPEQSNGSSALRSSLQPDDDDDELDFDPFSTKDITPFPITVSDFDTQWSNSSASNASMSPEDYRYFDNMGYQHPYYAENTEMPSLDGVDPDGENFMLTDGMTPFDVLSSVFGSTLAPSELEEALANNAYDFERAMAWLIDRSLPAAQSQTHQGPLAAHSSVMLDEFPALNFENGGGKGRRGGPSFDPSRTRFSAAVKKQVTESPAAAAARREVMGSNGDNLHLIAPRPSPRIKLHAPTLLPTLPTGESVNQLYLAYRSRALQLGAARNACLSRAAAAWRRGDGSSAKRFSREGHELNAKMSAEMADAASQLVRERAKLAEQAVRARDANWSDDPGDRTCRGRPCGGGLGICLGIARRDTGGEGKLTSEERTECALDLHGLHSNEATEVLEEFLLALEREHFYGLAYVVVGEEKHTGTQDPARGASRSRLATGVREWVHRWGYPWSERDGILCIDPLTHASE
ncbi:hypothetical protein ONZ45_g711 [Pleurotus djamor]|nr:hypothetical protein ONZ45_g711 [Pleurotus djamor]